jgi:hypothetical protein
MIPGGNVLVRVVFIVSKSFGGADAHICERVLNQLGTQELPDQNDLEASVI